MLVGRRLAVSALRSAVDAEGGGAGGVVLLAGGVVMGDESAIRFRTYDLAATYVRSRAAQRPLVIVIDDLHWADVSSLRLLVFGALWQAGDRVTAAGRLARPGPGSGSGTCGSGSVACSPPGTWTMTPTSGTRCPPSTCRPWPPSRGPPFLGGVHQELIGALQRYDQVAEAFRRGGEARPVGLHPDAWAGTSRLPVQWHQTCSSSSGCLWSRRHRPSCEPAPG